MLINIGDYIFNASRIISAVKYSGPVEDEDSDGDVHIINIYLVIPSSSQGQELVTIEYDNETSLRAAWERLCKDIKDHKE